MSETMYTLIGTLLIVMMIPGGRHIVRGAIKAVTWLVVFALTRENRRASREAERRRREARERWTYDDEDEWRPGGDEVGGSMEEVLEELRRHHREGKGLSVSEQLELDLKRSDEWWTLAVDLSARHQSKVRARRKLSNRFHPDKFPSDDAALQAAANMCQQTINAQWEIYEAARHAKRESEAHEPGT